AFSRGRIAVGVRTIPRRFAPHGNSRGRTRPGYAAGAGSPCTLGGGRLSGLALRVGCPRPRHPAPPPALSPPAAGRPQSPDQPVRLLARYPAERLVAGRSPGGLARHRAP